MDKQFYFVFILLLSVVVFAQEHRYCQLESCPNRTHTLCKYPEAGAAQACGTISSRGLTPDEKMIILFIYNRNVPSITLYEEPNYSEVQPDRITLQYRMTWDIELAEIAQRWADQCISSVDECRNVERFLVRQRSHFIRSDVPYMPIIHPVILRWRNEDRSPIINNLYVQHSSLEEAVVSTADLFSQLMRHHENRIGCGAVRAYDDDYEYLHLVCNYGIRISPIQE